MTWVLIAWSTLILIWAIAGGADAAEDCENEAERTFQEACEAGAGIGILLILFIGFIGFVFFSLIWFMTRPQGSPVGPPGVPWRKGEGAARHSRSHRPRRCSDAVKQQRS
jgi:hypothetical protein